MNLQPKFPRANEPSDIDNELLEQLANECKCENPPCEGMMWVGMCDSEQLDQ